MHAWNFHRDQISASFREQSTFSTDSPLHVPFSLSLPLPPGEGGSKQLRTLSFRLVFSIVTSDALDSMMSLFPNRKQARESQFLFPKRNTHSMSGFNKAMPCKTVFSEVIDVFTKKKNSKRQRICHLCWSDCRQ